MARRGGLRDSDVNFAPEEDGQDDDVDFAPPDAGDVGMENPQAAVRRKLKSLREGAEREAAAAEPPLEDLPEPPIEEDMDEAAYKAALVRSRPNSFVFNLHRFSCSFVLLLPHLG